MVQSYKILKQQLSGEGFNFDLKEPKGLNWTLQSKPVMVRRENGDVWITPASSMPNGDLRLGEARVVIDNHVSGTNIISNGNTKLHNGEMSPHDDKISYESFASNNTGVRDELYHISEEVKAIKLMLEGKEGGKGKVPNGPGPVTVRRYYETEYAGTPVSLNQPPAPNVVHFSASTNNQGRILQHERQYGQPTFRNSARRRDFGLGLVMVKNNRMSSRHVVRPVVSTYYEPPLKTREVVRRVHSVGPPSPTSPQPYLVAHTNSSSTIPRSIENVYRHRASSRGSNTGRPIVLINPVHKEPVRVSQNLQLKRKKSDEKEIVVTEMVSEHVPVEVEQRVVEVYNVEDVKKGIVEKEDDVEEGYEASGENDSKIVNVSTFASDNRLADLDDPESDNDDERTAKVVVSGGEEVTIIRTEVLEEEPVEFENGDIKLEKRVRIEETYPEVREASGFTGDDSAVVQVVSREEKESYNDNYRYGDDHDDVIELREERRVVKKVVRIDVADDSDEEEPYVMDKEKLMAYTSEPEIVIVGKEGDEPREEYEEKLEHYDYETSKGTTETTVTIETVTHGGEEEYSKKVVVEEDFHREMIETDAYRSEDQVLF